MPSPALPWTHNSSTFTKTTIFLSTTWSYVHCAILPYTPLIVSNISFIHALFLSSSSFPSLPPFPLSILLSSPHPPHLTSSPRLPTLLSIPSSPYPPLLTLPSSPHPALQAQRDGMLGRTDHAPPAPPSTHLLYGLVLLDESGLLLPHRCAHYLLSASTMASVYPLLHIDWHHFFPLSYFYFISINFSFHPSFLPLTGPPSVFIGWIHAIRAYRSRHHHHSSISHNCYQQTGK